MEEIRDLLARLNELTNEELETAIQRVRDLATELAAGEIDSETADQLTELADALDQFTARQDALQAEQTEREERAQAALARINGTAGGEDGEGGEEQPPAEGQPEEQPAAAATPPVAASSRPPLPTPGQMRSRNGAPPPPPAAPPPLRATTVIVAAADLGSGISSGQAFDTLTDELAEAFDRRRQAIMRASTGHPQARNRALDSPGENVPVLTLRTTYPEERRLTDDAQLNRQRIREATSPRAMVAGAQIVQAANPRAVVAAGGLCAPVETLYDIDILGSTSRPVRDALVGFNTTRGGLTYRQQPVFQDSEGATSVWTLADDATIGDPDVADAGPKPCLDVWCPDMDTAYIEAVPFCQTFHNITARFDPESTAANLQAGRIAQARFAENRLMGKIAQASKTLTSPATVSGSRDWLVMTDHVIAYWRNRHRLEDAVPARMIGPRWARDLIRADFCRGLASVEEGFEAMALADAMIAGWFATRGVNIAWHIDGRAAVAGAAGVVGMPDQFYADVPEGSPVPGFPNSAEWFIFQEGDLLFLDGGTIDLGIVRDSTLNATNEYRQFAETFEGLAKRGVEPLRIVADAQPTGAVVGMVAPALAD